LRQVHKENKWKLKKENENLCYSENTAGKYQYCSLMWNDKAVFSIDCTSKMPVIESMTFIW